MKSKGPTSQLVKTKQSSHPLLYYAFCSIDTTGPHPSPTPPPPLAPSASNFPPSLPFNSVSMVTQLTIAYANLMYWSAELPRKVYSR